MVLLLKPQTVRVGRGGTELLVRLWVGWTIWTSLG